MKKVSKLILAICCSAVSTIGFGQHAFTNCSAAFLDNKMVVDKYSPTGKCRLSSNATGKLTVCTVNLLPTASQAVSNIPFRIAIRNKTTKTLLLLTKADVRQIDVHNVLTKCKKGDHIVLLTLDDQYAMPHNEILVQ